MFSPVRSSIRASRSFHLSLLTALSSRHRINTQNKLVVSFLVQQTSWNLGTMWLLIFMVPGIFGMTRSAPVAFGDEECQSDNDCPENTFCYETSHLCAPCNPNYCSRFNRANSSWRQCHKEAKECGNCLEGYNEEILTDGSPREACILAPVSKKYATSQHSVQPVENQKISYLAYSALVVLGILAVASMVVFTRRRYHHVILQHIPCPLDETDSATRTDGRYQRSAPPPYYFPNISLPHLSSGNTEEGMPLNQRSSSTGQVDKHLLSASPSAPLLTTDASIIPHVCEEPTVNQPVSQSIETQEYEPRSIEGQVKCETIRHVQAVPCREADYQKNASSGFEDPVRDDDSQDENSDFDYLNYDDEATVPSPWTPASTSASAEPSNNDDDCNATNIQTATKRVSSEAEVPNSDPETGSRSKRMKTHEGNDEQPEQEDRAFCCFSQNQNLNEQDHQRDDHSD